jgi:hypothetical protein
LLQQTFLIHLTGETIMDIREQIVKETKVMTTLLWSLSPSPSMMTASLYLFSQLKKKKKDRH